MTYFEGPREARRFSEIAHAPMTGKRWRYLSNKLTDKAIAAELGIRTAQIYATYDAAEEIDLSKLPDRFALKATNMSTNHGVFIIRRQGAHYYDLRRRLTYTGEELIAALATTVHRGRAAFAAPVIAEEFIIGENGPDEIPYDYKMYVFDGSVEMVEQLNRQLVPPGLAFFNRDFEPLEPHCIIPSERIQSTPHVRPRNWQALLDAARRLSLRIDVPFVSVDTYTNGTDVIFGELTEAPGPPYYGNWRFSDEFDAELGTYYRLALRRRGIPMPIVDGLPPVLRKHQRQLEEQRAEEQKRLDRATRTPSIRTSARLLAAAIKRRFTDGR